MPQRNPSTKTPESTSLRRSPRLLQLKLAPKTPIPQIRSIIPPKSPINLNDSGSILMNYEKLSNGFGNGVKLGNGSRRKSGFGNGLIGGSVCRKLKKVGFGEIDCLGSDGGVGVCSPVTPVGVGDEKGRGFIGVCGGSETGSSERRVTRGFVKKIGGNVGGGGKCGTGGSGVLSVGEEERRVTRTSVKKIGGSAGKCETRSAVLMSLGGSERRVMRGCAKKMSGLNERDLFDDCDRDCVGGSRLRKCVRSVRGAVGNDDGESVCRSVVCGLKSVGCDSPRLPSSVAGVGKGRCNRKNVSERSACNAGKRVVKRSDLCERVEGDKVKEKECNECVKVDGDKPKNGTNVIGVKRKRKQVGFVGKDQGWTIEQEAMLQRAYFTAKPSPHFWKRVSKLVPGKSAQECFDKVHSADLTPLSARNASRLKKQNSPSECLISSDELLKSIPTKSKRQFKTKQKSHVTRRNVRHLLQKYCQDSEADLFSVLEPSGSPLADSLKLKAVQLTPTQSLGSPLSSGRNSRLSRLSGVIGSPLTSPLVLKKVKNMALHEKYIDQLHKREGKRKVVFSRYSKSVQFQNDGAQNSAQRKGIIKAAKDALASDARDVIEKFRDSQTNLMEAYSDSEEFLVSDNDEDDLML